MTGNCTGALAALVPWQSTDDIFITPVDETYAAESNRTRKLTS